MQSFAANQNCFSILAELWRLFNGVQMKFIEMCGTNYSHYSDLLLAHTFMIRTYYKINSPLFIATIHWNLISF